MPDCANFRKFVRFPMWDFGGFCAKLCSYPNKLVKGLDMGDDRNAWREILKEFDSETMFWAEYSLHPAKKALHFAPWESAPIKGKLSAPKQAPNRRKYYPYVDGLENALREALIWMKAPPKMLRVGLLALSNGRPTKNLPALFKLYGEFCKHIGVLYARDPEHAGFVRQRQTGINPSQNLKRFAASFMIAAIRKRGASTKDGIKEARHWLEEFAADIVLGNCAPPDEFAAYDFSALLQKALEKKGSSKRSLLSLHEKFRKELTSPLLEEWVDEALVSKIQELGLIRP